MKSLHPGFKAVADSIAKKSGVSEEAAGAILAKKTRDASPMAKKKNPRLKRVVGAILLALTIPSISYAQTNACTNPTLVQSAAISVSASGDTRFIQNSQAGVSVAVVICKLDLTIVGAATANVVIAEYGTGASCGTGKTTLGSYTGNTTVGGSTVIHLDVPYKLPTATDFCLNLSQAISVTGSVTYLKQP